MVAIHPFADGNGRVARALASVFTFRELSLPILILVENRSQYLTALRAADRGEHQEFVDFMLDRTVEAVRLIEESFRSAAKPSVDGVIAELKRLYVTRGGYRHEEVDAAGSTLLMVVREEMSAKAKELAIDGVLSLGVEEMSGGHPIKDSSYRLVAAAPRIRVGVQTAPPANVRVDLVFGLEVPKDCGPGDELRVVDVGGDLGECRARMSELLPGPTGALRMRVRIAVEGMLGQALERLVASAAKEVNRVYPPS